MMNRIGLMMLCATWIAAVGLAGCNGSGTEAIGAPTAEQALTASTTTPGSCPCAKSPDGQCNCGQHGPGECPHAKADGAECGCGGHGDAGCPFAQGGEGGCNCGEHGQNGQHDCAKHRAAEGAAVAPGPGGCPHAAGGRPHAAQASP